MCCFPAYDINQLQCCGDVNRLAPMLPGVVYELFLDYWQPSPGCREADIRCLGNRLSTFLRGAAGVHVHMYQNDILNVPKDQSTFDCSVLLEKLARKRTRNLVHPHACGMRADAPVVHLYTHKQYHTSTQLLLDTITLISGPIDGKAVQHVHNIIS